MELKAPQAGQKSLSGLGDVTELQLELLLPYSWQYGGGDALDATLSATDASGREEAVVKSSSACSDTLEQLCYCAFQWQVSKLFQRTHASFLPIAMILQGTLHVPKHVRRELCMCAMAELIMYRLHTPLQPTRGKVQLELCLSQDAFAFDVRGKSTSKV